MFPLDPTVAFIFASLLLALIASLVYSFWYQSMKFKSKQPASSASDSLKVSELETIIRTAVAEATASLGDRIELLEHETHSLRTALLKEHRAALPEPIEGPLLDTPEKEPDAQPIRSGQRVR